jgi:signal peptidase I
MSVAGWTGPGWRKVRPVRFVWSVLVPVGGTLIIYRYLVPPPMEGRSGGVVALLGRVADQHPLAVGVALFLALAATVGYWRARLRGKGAAAEAGAGEAAVRPDRRSWARLVVMMALAATLALGLRSSVAETYRVVSGSMIPTFMVGDRVLVNKLAYGLKLPFMNRRLWARPPRRGDVVVLETRGALAAEKLPTEVVVKRVIGLPGDRVSFAGDQLVVNGTPVPDCDAGPYATSTGKQALRGRLVVEILEGRAALGVRPVGMPPFPTFLVPPGQVFVVGDNRVGSSDSRMWNAGQGAGVPVDAITGRVTHIVAGARHEDGSLDLSSAFAPLAPTLRQTGVDVTKANAWIGECLHKQPASATR